MRKAGRMTARPLRRGADDGAAAVEFALLFPLFLLIVFGVINMGFGFNQKINLTQTAREASRYGATLSFASAGGDVDDWLAKVAAVAESSGGADLADDREGRYICVAHVEEGATGTASSLVVGTGGPASSAPCYDDGRDDERVQVVVRSQTALDFILFGGEIELGSESTTHYEAAA